jgi:malonyl CoA-acyl carrier protein transacylase
LFQPADGLPGRPPHAALLDDRTVPPVSFGDPEVGPHDLGPVQKLATEMTALALIDADRQEGVATTRTGLIIGSATPSVCDLAELGIDPIWLALQARAGTLGTDEMRVYAGEHAGLFAGKGCGIVVLARVADARAAGVPVYAEITGWSTPPTVLPALAQLRRGGKAVAIPATSPAAAVPVIAPSAAPGCEAPGRHMTPARATGSARAGQPPSIFALRGGNPGAVAERLDDIAVSAATLSDAELRELARQLAVGVLGAAGQTAPLRVALTAAAPSRLADQARYAAWLLRTGGTTSATTEPGTYVSAGATGTVIVLFPGRAESAAAQPARLAVSLEALGTLDLLGVKPVTGVGYGLGEVTGLVWAGSLPAAEAARLVAQCGQVLRACGYRPAAMARITADAEVTRALCAPDRLYIAAYEAPRVHVLAGSTAGIRELARRADPLGVPVEVLAGTSAMHCPAMARCVAPLRSVLAGTRVAPPQRRLISTITGHLLTAADDIADLLARQVSLPVLFAQTMTKAAQDADLIVTAGPDTALAAMAAECCGIPAVAVPAPTQACLGGPDAGMSATMIAALFAAGAITDLLPFLAPSGPADTLASGAIPRMRMGEPAESQAPQGLGGHAEYGDMERRTAVRSGQIN